MAGRKKRTAAKKAVKNAPAKRKPVAKRTATPEKKAAVRKVSKMAKSKLKKAPLPGQSSPALKPTRLI